MATFALGPIAGANLYMMSPTKYTFLNRSVSGGCAGINVPHPSQIGLQYIYMVLLPPTWKGYKNQKLGFMCFRLFPFIKNIESLVM